MKKIIILASFLLAAACISTTIVPTGETQQQRRRPVFWKNVRVFETADKVPGKYEEMGLILSSGSTFYTNEADMLKSMMKAAAKMGANAIILNAVSEPKDAAKIAASVLGVGGSVDRKGKALAIYVLPAEPAQEPAK